MEKAAEKRKINVIDSIMGSGKTSWAIQTMNEASSFERFIYITPFLDEVDRIRKGVEGREFFEPNNRNDEGRKLRSLKDLIVQGKDIASTHSLFKTADDELIELLTDSGYTLILDEVFSCVEPITTIQRTDIRRLKETEELEIVDGKVIWTGDDDITDRYTDVMLLAQAGNLYSHDGKYFVWAFPPRVFEVLDRVYVMTYLFDAQEMRYYFDMYGFNYEYQAVKFNDGRYELAKYDVKSERREEIIELIDIYEGKMNNIGQRRNAFGASYLRNRRKSGDDEFFEEVTRNIRNYFQNIVKAKRDDVYYSTLKEVESIIQPRGYKEPHKPKGDKDTAPQVVIPHNTRATNQYADKWAIAYIFNRYMHMSMKKFFQSNGVSVYDDLLAISDLLQWIWRSRIRNGEPIKLYLPSSRMRGLLKRWANYEI